MRLVNAFKVHKYLIKERQYAFVVGQIAEKGKGKARFIKRCLAINGVEI
jgi:hypothetical protein